MFVFRLLFTYRLVSWFILHRGEYWTSWENGKEKKGTRKFQTTDVTFIINTKGQQVYNTIRYRHFELFQYNLKTIYYSFLFFFAAKFFYLWREGEFHILGRGNLVSLEGCSASISWEDGERFSTQCSKVERLQTSLEPLNPGQKLSLREQSKLEGRFQRYFISIHCHHSSIRRREKKPEKTYINHVSNDLDLYNNKKICLCIDSSIWINGFQLTEPSFHLYSHLLRLEKINRDPTTH